MQISCNTKELNSALEKAVRFVSKKGYLPSITGILLEATDRLTIRATDLESYITITMDASIFEGGMFVVPKEFRDIVKSLKTDTVNLHTFEGTLTINNTLTVSEVTPPDEFPPPLKMNRDFAFDVSTHDFTSALKRVLPSVSTDDSRLMLTGVLVEMEGFDLTLISTDGFRLATHGVNGVCLSQSVQPLRLLYQD